MGKTQSDLSKLTEKLSAPGLPFDGDEMSVVRLRPADMAKLLGYSRARVSQLVKAGTISTFANGSLDPSKCVAELIRADPTGTRFRVLSGIRAQLDQAEGQAVTALLLRDEMAAERDRIAAELDDVRDVLREVAQVWLTEARWLAALDSLTCNIAAGAFDQAAEIALGATLGELLTTADPELIAAIASVDPDGPIATTEPAPAADPGQDSDIGILTPEDMDAIDAMLAAEATAWFDAEQARKAAQAALREETDREAEAALMAGLAEFPWSADEAPDLRDHPPATPQ